MPGKVKVRVVAGRNLPVMDRSSDTTDAYVEVKLGTTTHKTDVFRKSLNPQWNSEWFRFEVDDSELQDEPLQIRLMDHDTYSANDAIGKVYVDLNPLLLPPAPPQHPQRHPHDPAQQTSALGGAMMMGWLPVFDTMHGIRGEVNIVVKVDLFSDFNKFRQSSCGVQFFFTPEIPAGHQCQNILGFVEELVVNDDPEYQWIDKIRTPRASNEARQTLFSKLSGELQRRIGLKVLELGGNAVIGYRHCFDLEGESGIVVRGMGSAVTLMRLHQDAPSPLREGGLHREHSENEMVLENLYVSMPTSADPMPISVVHIPRKLSSPLGMYSAQGPQARTTIAHPSQWLDLMVTPCASVGTYQANILSQSGSSPKHKYAQHYPPQISRKLSLTGARHMISGLAIVGKKRSGTITQYPAVHHSKSEHGALPMSTNLALVPPQMRRVLSSPMGSSSIRKGCQVRKSQSARWPSVGRLLAEGTEGSSRAKGKRSMKPHENLDTIRAGLRKTAQKVMKFKGSGEKSYSVDYDDGIYESGTKKKTSMKSGRKPRLFRRQQHISVQFNEGDGDQDENELPVELVELTGMDEEEEGLSDVTSYWEDEYHGSEVTNIECSFKMLSSTLSDPTLNKSYYAQRILAKSRVPQGPIQFISSEEDTSSSDPTSDLSSPEYQRSNTWESSHQQTHSPQQKFYISEESISESSTSLDSHFTGPVEAADRASKLSHTRSTSWSLDEPVTAKTPPTTTTIKSQVEGKTEHDAKTASVETFISSSDDFSLCGMIHAVGKSRMISSSAPELPGARVDKSCFCGAEVADHEKCKEISINEHCQIDLPYQSDICEERVPQDDEPLHDKEIEGGLNDTKSLLTQKKQPPSVLHVSPGHLPDINLIPSTPVAPRAIMNTHEATIPGPCERSALQLNKEQPRQMQVLGPSSSESSCSPICSSSSSSSDALCYLGSNSMSSVVSPDCASVDDVSSKCVPQPVYISSLEALVEPRGSSGSGNLTGGVMGVVGSPKRSSRSRHTSGTCHPVSRSPVPSVEPDTPRTPATPAAAIMEAGGVGTVSGQAASASTGIASGATHSPTHSGKLSSPARTPGVAIHRRSSDSDLSITPKGGGSLAGSGGSSGGGGGGGVVGGRGTFSGGHRPFLTQDSFEMLEYPFLTMKSFPPGFVLHLGGTVSARSVKVLDRIHNPEEPETRDTWWTELRMEMRSHARALCCNVVLGYEEFTTMCDEICILNAMGTAAVISLHYHDSSDASLGLGANVMPAAGGTMAGGVAGVNRNLKDPMTLSLDRKDFEQQQAQQQQLQHKPSHKENISGPQAMLRHRAVSSPRPLRRTPSVMSRSQPGTSEEGGGGSSGEGASGPTSVAVAGGHVGTTPPSCGLCHVPYSDTSLPFRVKISKCNICRRGKVPDVLFTTLEPPSSLAITGRGTMIQARVAKVKKDLKGELNAKDISDSLPFLEYELHRQLMNKLKVKGMNALFGLRVRVTVGEKMLVGVATATAVFLSALPPPSVLRVHAASSGYDDEKKRLEVQRLLQEAMITNKDIYGVKVNSAHTDGMDELNCSKGSDTDDSEDDMPDMDLSSGNKDTYVLELDDAEDAEMISVLLEPRPPNYVEVVSTELPPGVPPDQIVAGLQMFTRVWRSKILPNVSHTTFNQYFDRILQSIYFKVRKLSPCVLAGIKVDVELPDEDEVQISILGMVLGQGAPAPSIPHTYNALQHICAPQHSSQGGSGDQFKKHKQDEGEMIFKMEEVVHGTEEASGKAKPSTSTTTSTTASSAVTTTAASTTTASATTTTPTTSTSTAASVGTLPGVSSWQSLGTTASTLSFPSVASGASLSSSSSARSSLRSRHDVKSSIVYHRSPCERYGVEITPLSYIPGARLDRHLGNLNFFFIRESTSIKESGGLSGFMGSFVTEVLAMVRAHVAALGGNAMIAYFMSECSLQHTPHKNQGHCLINVGGDVVKVSYGLENSLEAPVEE